MKTTIFEYVPEKNNVLNGSIKLYSGSNVYGTFKVQNGNFMGKQSDKAGFERIIRHIINKIKPVNGKYIFKTNKSEIINFI